MVKFSSNCVDTKWVTYVKEIRSFIDESYKVSLRGNLSYNHSKQKVAWGRTGLEKFYSRIIPQLDSPERKTRRLNKIIRLSIKDTVTYGNSTIIISEDGNIRVSNPLTSYASKDPFGDITFKEFLDAETKSYSVNGILSTLTVNEDTGEEEYVDYGDRTFTIFYGESTMSQSGKSRISPAIISSILAASRNLVRTEEAADKAAFPLRVLNGIFDSFVEAGVDEGALEQGALVQETIHKLKTGVDTVLGLPLGPNGEKMSVEQYEAADFSSFEILHRNFAKDVASAFNIDVTELGVTTAVPSSAEALYASKEDLILEVEAFENEIQDDLQDMIDYYTGLINEKECKLGWSPAATPSKGSQADAFVKLASVIPQMAYSRRALLEAGFSSAVVDELLERSTIEISPERLKELEDGFAG